MSLTYAQLIDGSVVSISFGAGTQSAPSLYYTVDTTTGIFFPGTGTLALTTSGTERLRVTSTGLVGIGSTVTSGGRLTVQAVDDSSNGGIALRGFNDGSANGDRTVFIEALSASANYRANINYSSWQHIFTTNATERGRWTSDGKFLVGTSTARSNLFNAAVTAGFQLEGTGENAYLSVVQNNTTATSSPIIVLAKSRGTTVNSNVLVANNDALGALSFQGNDGTEFVEAARISCEVDTAPGANVVTGRLIFSTAPSTSGLLVERVRIDNAGKVGIGLAGSVNQALLHLAAGTTGAFTSSLKIEPGSLLTNAEVGATEFDGSSLYFTTNTTSTGRGQVVARQIFRLAANGSAIGPTIADYFGATSSINLPAAGAYEIEYFLYFTKTTAGTVTFTLTASSAPTGIFGTFIGAPATGVGSGAPQSGYTGAQAAATAAFPATASLTTAVNHTYTIRAQVITNAATTFKVQVTSSLGTVTPLAGSFYAVRRVAASTGSFA
jgi:hypothetical protein